MDSVLDTLDEQTKVQLLSKVIGFNELPVDIDTFIHDDYYLGSTCGIDEDLGIEKTRKVWQDQLKEVFPNPISCLSFVANTGAIGTGKSFDAKIIILYQIYKLICAKDPYSWNRLYERDKPFIVFVGHTEKYKAQDEVNNLFAFMESSPYFNEQLNNPDSFIHNIKIVPGSEPGAFIGKNLIISWI